MSYWSRHLWLLPFLSFIIGYLGISYFHTSKTLKAPALVGYNLEKAVTILCEHNLNIRIIDHKIDPDLTQGTFVSQTPVAGKSIKENQTIYVVIAQKPAAILMPNFYHKSSEQITAELEKLGLSAKIFPLPADNPDNLCIAQFPAAGAEVNKNAIIIYIAGTPKPVIMPQCKGKPLDEVLEFFSLHGITSTILQSQQQSEIGDSGQPIILDQRPVAGSLVTWTAEKPLHVQLQVIQ
jgi:beta-lactam-binding protein with PASTA domain